MRALLLSLFLLHAAAAFSEEIRVLSPETVGMSGERLEYINGFVADNIESGKHAGLVTLVSRHGHIVHFEAAGTFGVDNDKPLQKDSLFRIFSMTKPITAVAMLMLYEEGKFQLNDPVAKYIPEMADMQVLQDGELVDVESPMIIHHLFTHTAGLSYGWIPGDAVDAAYVDEEIWQAEDLDDFAARIGSTPLRFQPGDRYFYSVATDVLGVLVERLSGMSLDDYFRTRIFEPLGMQDTYFNVPAEKLDRLADNHAWNAESQQLVPLPDEGRFNFIDGTLYSGGGGLVSTAMDYLIFCEMLRRGGTFNDVRLLGPKTVEYMSTNQLSDEVRNRGASDYPAMHLYPGQSFGLGVAVVTDPGLSQVTTSKGEVSWGGAADTKFWIDPREDLIAIVMTQLMGSPHETRYQMKVATYQALTETAKQRRGR